MPAILAGVLRPATPAYENFYSDPNPSLIPVALFCATGCCLADEKVSVLFEAPQVRLEQVKRPLRIPRIDARSPQTDYAAFLLLYDAPPLGDEFLGAAKIVFGIHLSK
jgi:hypothetical protein